SCSASPPASSSPAAGPWSRPCGAIGDILALLLPSPRRPPSCSAFRYLVCRDIEYAFQGRKVRLEGTSKRGGCMATSALGRKLRELRKGKGQTLDELAQKTESSKSYIWELENKPVARPSAEKLSRIATVLGVTQEFLMDETRTEVSIEERDKAFFRKYQSAKPEVREKISRILDVLDE